MDGQSSHNSVDIIPNRSLSIHGLCASKGVSYFWALAFDVAKSAGGFGYLPSPWEATKLGLGINNTYNTIIVNGVELCVTQAT